MTDNWQIECSSIFFVPISSFSVSSLFLWSHWRFTCEQVKINTLKLTLFFGPCAPLCRNMRTSEGILSLSLSLERKKTHSLLQDHKWMHTLHKLNYTFIQTRSTRLLKHMIASSLVKKWNYPLKPNTTCHIIHILCVTTWREILQISGLNTELSIVKQMWCVLTKTLSGRVVEHLYFNLLLNIVQINHF